MKYILFIWIILPNGAPPYGGDLEAQEFNSRSACKTAITELRSALSGDNHKQRLNGICVPKGVSQDD